MSHTEALPLNHFTTWGGLVPHIPCIKYPLQKSCMGPIRPGTLCNLQVAIKPAILSLETLLQDLHVGPILH